MHGPMKRTAQIRAISAPPTGTAPRNRITGRSTEISVRPAKLSATFAGVVVLPALFAAAQPGLGSYSAGFLALILPAVAGAALVRLAR